TVLVGKDIDKNGNLSGRIFTAGHASDRRFDAMIDDVATDMGEREKEILNRLRQHARIGARKTDRLDLLAHKFGEIVQFALKRAEAVVGGYGRDGGEK